MTATLDGDELLNLDEVAQMLKCSRKQVLELTRSRSQARSEYPLPVIRINAKMLRVRRMDFFQWVEKVAASQRKTVAEVHASTAPKGSKVRHKFSVADLDQRVLHSLLNSMKIGGTK
jgi:hypothetical protein